MTTIVPILLSGGNGTRLWPLSRASKPKQFHAFGSDHTLFQEAVLRCRSAVFNSRPVVIGSKSHRFLLADNLAELAICADILLEPVSRNSAAAIAAGCLHALESDRQAVVLVLASDHHIPDRIAFGEAVATALPDALDGHLVTFGIKPDRPATGYGYIASGEPLHAALNVREFLEKPDARTAERFLRDGYMWNSGNFLFRASVFLEELRKFEPGILDATKNALARSRRDPGCITLDQASLEDARSLSVDYAVMERTSRAAVLPVEYQWSDIGNWDAASAVFSRDARQNATHGDVIMHESHGNVVHSADRFTAVLGIQDAVIVSTRDTVLVADRASAENVRQLVARLREQGRTEAELALKIFRPWGDYEQLDVGEGYQVKRITVNPGGELSLQKHRHRAEHWVVVRGEAEVTIGGTVATIGPNQAVHVPLGEVHRLANRGAETVVLIEVQSGDYLGEDDIIRLEDRYNRCEKPRTVNE